MRMSNFLNKLAGKNDRPIPVADVSRLEKISDDDTVLIRKLNPEDRDRIGESSTLYHIITENDCCAFREWRDKIPGGWNGSNPVLYQTEQLKGFPPIEIEFQDLKHQDASGKNLRMKFAITVEVVLESPSFAHQMKGRSVYTWKDLTKEIQNEKSGLKGFLQKVIVENDLSDMMNYTGEQIWTGQHSSTYNWIYVTSIQVCDTEIEKSELEKRCEAFNQTVKEKKQSIWEAQKNLEMMVELANIAAAEKSMEHGTILADLDRKKEVMMKEMLNAHALDVLKKKNYLELLEWDRKIQAITRQMKKDSAASSEIPVWVKPLLKAISRLSASVEAKASEQTVYNPSAAAPGKTADPVGVSFYEALVKPAIESILKQQLSLGVVMKKVSAETRYYSARDLALVDEKDSGELKIKSDSVRIGNNMRFSFRSDRSGYITLICIGSSCQPVCPDASVKPAVILLAPNIVDGSSRVEANREYSFPGREFLSNREILQEGPAGVERIIAVVSEKPLACATLPPGLKGFYNMPFEQFKRLLQELDNLEKDSWAAGILTYHVAV